MNFFSRASLRQMLTIPYVLLVVLAATVIGILSYVAGRDAVDTLSDHVLSETVNRITQAVDAHISGSEAVLETAFPSDIPAPLSISHDLDELRTRFWLATSIHRDPNNYVYYGNRKGQFIGLWRYSETEAELRLRTDGVSPRSIYQFSRIHGTLEDPEQEKRIFEPRERPWYKAGHETTKQTWTSIYIDFKTLQLVSTRARRVDNAAGEFEGVVATDLSMQLLNEFLKDLKLSPNGFAFIVEADGNLVATSRGPHLRKDAGEDNRRLSAMGSGDPWIATTYKAVKELTEHDEAPSGVRTSSFTGPNGAVVQAGYARLRDAGVGRGAAATARDERERDTGTQDPGSTSGHYGSGGGKIQSIRACLHNGVQAANAEISQEPDVKSPTAGGESWRGSCNRRPSVRKFWHAL